LSFQHQLTPCLIGVYPLLCPKTHDTWSSLPSWKWWLCWGQVAAILALAQNTAAVPHFSSVPPRINSIRLKTYSVAFQYQIVGLSIVCSFYKNGLLPTSSSASRNHH